MNQLIKKSKDWEDTIKQMTRRREKTIRDKINQIKKFEPKDLSSRNKQLVIIQLQKHLSQKYIDLGACINCGCPTKNIAKHPVYQTLILKCAQCNKQI